MNDIRNIKKAEKNATRTRFRGMLPN